MFIHCLKAIQFAYPLQNTEMGKGEEGEGGELDICTGTNISFVGEGLYLFVGGHFLTNTFCFLDSRI